MNPGSLAWLVPERPTQCEDCRDSFDAWPYGIGPGKPRAFPKYVRDEVLNNRSAIQQRYISRRVFYGFGTEDHGAGDTHCEAQWQGATRIERGRNFEKMLRDLYGGLPESHSVNYIEGLSHQDYYMVFDPSSTLVGADIGRCLRSLCRRSCFCLMNRPGFLYLGLHFKVVVKYINKINIYSINFTIYKSRYRQR